MDDARWLRRGLCGDMGKTVRVVAAAHFMSDHIAGMSLFPDALTIAHRHYRHTFLSQNRLVDEFYREPQVVFDSAMTIRWGQHRSEEHTSELQSLMSISYAVFCLKKKKNKQV